MEIRLNFSLKEGIILMNHDPTLENGEEIILNSENLNFVIKVGS
jgi:hypothetical protein